MKLDLQEQSSSREPGNSGNHQILTSRNLEILEITQFGCPGILEIVEISQHGVLGSWK